MNKAKIDEEVMARMLKEGKNLTAITVGVGEISLYYRQGRGEYV